MTHAQSFLDSLFGDAGGRSACCQAKAALGRVLCMLLSCDAQRVTGLRGTGATLIGGLACQAWTDWQAGRIGPEKSLCGRGEFDMDDDFAACLLQAMVAAAKADGQLTPAKRRALDMQLARLGVGAEAQALIAAEVESDLDPGRIAGLARSLPEAVEIYTASLLVTGADSGYLAGLAGRLGLAPDLVAHVHARARAAI